MKLASRLALFALIVTTAACATTGTSTRGNRDLIATEELRESPATDVYDLVRSLRPAWLRKRGQRSMQGPDEIAVYYDNARMGNPESLRQIPTAAAMSVRFFDAAAANYRWGSGHTHGAILVSTGEAERR